MKASLRIAGATAWLLSWTPLVSAEPSRLSRHHTPIEIVGNVVLSDDVYLTLLAVARGVPAGGTLYCPAPTIIRELVQIPCAETSTIATSTITLSRSAPPLGLPQIPASQGHLAELLDSAIAEEAQRVEDLISDFLHASGYELAHVDAYPRGGRIIVSVDEGRLDKIVFIGQNVFRILELQVSFNLPGNVFNRSLIDQRLAEMKRLFHLESARYEILSLDPEAGERMDVDKADFLRRLEILRPAQAHELHVFLIYPERQPGLHLDLIINSVNGIMLDGSYLFKGLFASGDRFQVDAGAGARIVDPFSSEADRLSLARVKFGASWSTPPLALEWLRATASFEGDLRGRRRFDLEVRRYFYFTLRAELDLELQGADIAQLSLGGGVEQAYLFGLKPLSEVPIPAEVTAVPGESFRAFVRARGKLRFNPSELRLSRDHGLQADVRYYPQGDKRGDYASLEGSYRGTLMLGSDEAKVRLQAALVAGDVSYAEEIQLGAGPMMVAYQHAFVDRVAAIGLQYRVALNGDRFKVGVFDTAAVVSGLKAAPERVELLNEVGLGAHFLWLDSIEVDGYLGLGLSTQRGDELSFGVMLQIAEAY